jgi:catecholate siderophore receptor
LFARQCEASNAYLTLSGDIFVMLNTSEFKKNEALAQYNIAGEATKKIANCAVQTTRMQASLLPLGAMMLAGSMAAMAQTAAPSVPAGTPTAPSALEQTLKPVTVTDQRGREAQGYNPGTTAVGKQVQALRDIPNSVTVVPEQLMHDRNADTFKEALRNVAGLTFNASEGGRVGDNITLRGFSVVGDLYLDNIRDIAQYNRETFNLESIDVLRGSASMLFGRGSTGGVINQVSKVPRIYQVNEATVTLGTDNYKRATVDLNRAINDTTAVRLNVLAHDQGSFRDEVTQQRVAIAPSIRFGAGTANDLTLSYYYLREKNLPDYGVPYLNGLPLAVPVNTFYGLANADYEHNSASIFTAAYTHKFSQNTSLKTVLRKASYQRDLWVTAPRLATGTTALDANTVISRGRPARGGEESPLTLQSDLNASVQTLGMKHDIIAGVELARETSARWTNGNGLINPPTTASQIANPTTNALLPNANPLLAADYFSSQLRYSPNSYTGNTTGLYMQDTVSLTPQWKAVVGLRHDRLSADYTRTNPVGSFARTDAVTSKRLGIIYQPTETSSYYASWGTSFNPSAELYQLDAAGSNTPPELNKNVELGAKWDLMDGDLALRTAVFRTTKTNERNTDVSSPNVFLLSGRRHTSGIEFEVAGRMTKAWEVFSSYSSQRGNIDEASFQQAGSLDKTPINTPNYTASIWSTYRINERWKAGGGIEKVGLRYANTANTNALPSYTRLDAMVEYKFEPYALQLNIKNLLNKDYYEGVYAGHVVPGTKRSVQVSMNMKF